MPHGIVTDRGTMKRGCLACDCRGNRYQQDENQQVFHFGTIFGTIQGLPAGQWITIDIGKETFLLYFSGSSAESVVILRFWQLAKFVI
jgi:hypothetical protein